MGYCVDRYLFDGASQGLPSSSSKLELLKGASLGSHFGVSSTFMSEEQLADQYENLKVISEDQIK